MGSAKDTDKSAVWMVIASAIMSLSMVAYHRLMSQTLGNSYDELFALTGVINILAVFTMGVSANLTKGFAAEHERFGSSMVKAALIRMAPKLALGLSVMGLFLLAAGTFLGEYLKIPGFYLVVLMVGLFLGGMVIQILRSAVQGMHRFDYLGVSYIVEGLGRVGFGAGLVLAGFGVAGALGSTLLAQVGGVAVVGFCLWKIKPDHEGLAAREAGSLLARIKELGNDSLVLVLFSVIGYLDVLVTKHHYGDQLLTLVTGEQAQRAATFARASLVGKAFLYLTSALNVVLLPVVAAARAAGRDPRPIFFRYLTMAAAILVMGLAFVWWQTDWVIRILCGPNPVILHRANLVRWYCVAVIPLSLFQLVLFYHLALATRWLWVAMLMAALTFYGLLEWQHDHEMMIVASIGGVSTVLLIGGIFAAMIKTPPTRESVGEKA